MLRKDKRSILLCMVLGDGCLYERVYSKNISSGKFIIDRGIAQSDYQSWKASLVSNVFEKEVKVTLGHRGKSVQVQINDKRMRSWRKFFYKDNKKNIPKILEYIRHPELALMIWLMDDGYVESSIKKGVNRGARFRLFTCDQTLEQQDLIIKWFETSFNVKPYIKFANNKKTGKTYPFLKFNGKDSMKLWNIIRHKVLEFKSMQYKFRYVEQMYQYKLIQRIPQDNCDDMFQTSND